MIRMLAIGPWSVIRPFQALGLELAVSETPQETRQKIRQLHGGFGEGVIFLTDGHAGECAAEIGLLRRNAETAILSLPDPSREPETGDARHQRTREMIRRAVGVDLLGERKRP